MSPDLLSERIAEFRAWFGRYSATGVAIAPEAMVAYDALFADFVTEARNLEERIGAIGATGVRGLDHVVADLAQETLATDAFTASMARTKERIVRMRAAQDTRDATERAVLAGVEAGRVALFPITPRSVFGHAARAGDVPVEAALDFIAAATRDAPKSRFDDAPTFDTPEDCA
ncbi:MAG: hypothetical protein QM651_15180 [Rhodoblastus sp.]